ncbi:dual specificity protein phosphatase family protein [Verrucosispora sp. FIM060022]|uniref:protein-tyrosine phosphatase family protein n=1 Tax=Verrucosispora sp. FIM060022 TaxID=1479020 RepID=UPI000F869616|nr:dual specificity protein phosphatase family protein [Verrucosispora sp. FIM060022]RUL89841.1 tyrosine protein phosphatase [Verrucosispora sp. FIM060022]
MRLTPTLYRIPTPSPGQLSTMPRPRGDDWLDDEMIALRDLGVDVLVCLLTPTEAAELGLTGEAAAATNARLEFHALPVDDLGVPDRALAQPLLDLLHDRLTGGRHVAVHCRAGIGRSSLIAAACLLRLGAPLDDVWKVIGEARGVSVPETDEQRHWPLTSHVAPVDRDR